MRVFILSVESGVKECVEMFGLKQYYFLITRLNQGIGQPLRTVLFSAMYLDSVYRVYIHIGVSRVVNPLTTLQW